MNSDGGEIGGIGWQQLGSDSVLLVYKEEGSRSGALIEDFNF